MTKIEKSLLVRVSNWLGEINTYAKELQWTQAKISFANLVEALADGFENIIYKYNSFLKEIGVNIANKDRTKAVVSCYDLVDKIANDVSRMK